jgi:hypothetical protein
MSFGMRTLGVSFFFVGAFLAACSSSSSTTGVKPCNEDPFQCPAGQTCWIKDQTGVFACLNSQSSAKKGDACVNIQGSPSCGDGMLCFQQLNEATGHCVDYCDNTVAGKGCAAGELCREAGFQSNLKVHVCIGATPAGNDGGTDSGSASDAGTTTDSGTTADATAD